MLGVVHGDLLWWEAIGLPKVCPCGLWALSQNCCHGSLYVGVGVLEVSFKELLEGSQSRPQFFRFGCFF